MAFNTAHPDGPRIAIWPLAGFVYENVGTVYFLKVLLRDYFDLTELGIGIARIRFGKIGTRLRPEVDEEYPTLLWRTPRAKWGEGVFLDEDGYVYLYGCYRRSAFDPVCELARVDPERVMDITAYEYADLGGWTPYPENAVIVVEGPGTVTASYNQYLEKYIIVYTKSFSDDVIIQTADNPWGPFNERRKMFTGDPQEDWFISRLHLHPAYYLQDGKTLFLTYYSSSIDSTPGMRMNYFELY